MKHLLVTGGLGFLGSELVKTLLDAGYENIHVLDDLSTGSILNRYQGVTYHIHTVCDREKLASLMQSVSFECIFHFAALPRILPSFLDPSAHNDANVAGTLVLLETFNRYTKPDCVFINSSSSSVYGSPLTTPSEEADKVSPLNPYALQKYTAETYVTLLCRYWNRKFTNLRYFNPYGPRSYNPKNPMNAYSSVIGIWLENAKAGLPIVVYGTGDQRRDFIHSADVARINYKCYRLLESGVKVPEVLNVGTGKTHSLNEIIVMLNKHKDIRVIRKDSRPGEASVTHASTRLLDEYIKNYCFQALENYIEEYICA